MDMAPLIDVVFLLLIFFMLTFAVLGQGLNINLPDGSAVESETVEEEIYLLIDPQSNIRLNGNPVPMSELSGILASRLENRRDKVVTLKRTRPHALTCSRKWWTFHARLARKTSILSGRPRL